MPGELREKIADVNSRIFALLIETRQALKGEKVFGVEQVRELSKPITEMTPVMARAEELRALQPEIAEELDLYKIHLIDLQTALEQVRMMLIAYRSQMESHRAHLDAVSQWTKRFSHTQ